MNYKGLLISQQDEGYLTYSEIDNLQKIKEGWRLPTKDELNYIFINRGKIGGFAETIINQDGITLILCDGGSKINEFNLLSNYMKIGDFIMAHDYSENEETFKENVYMKIWNWHEIADKDIQEACNRNNLISHNKEIFNTVAWVCKVKQ